MKRGWIFFILFIFFSLNALAQSDTVVFNGTIPELVIKTGANANVLNLSEYFFSNNTVEYKYKAGDDGIEGLVIEIKDDSRVSIEASSPGSRSVIFIGDDDTTAVDSNEINIKISGDPIITISFSPNTDTVSLNENDEQVFAVSSGNQSIEWYLDNVKLNQTSNTYSFSNSTVGVHTVRVVSGSETKTWTVSVLAESITNPNPAATSNTTETETESSGPVCGNNIREQGENCGNCAADVSCAINTECLNGICVPKKTGINFNFVLWLVLLAAVIIAVVTGVVITRKKRAGRISAGSSETFNGKKSFFDKIKNLFKKKNENQNQNQIGQKPSAAEEKIEKIGEVDLNPLMMYFKTNLNKYKKEVLIKQALQQGWKQEQIDEALSKLGTGEGNDNNNEDKETS